MDATERRHVEVDHDGQVVGSADVTVDTDTPSTATIAVHAQSGHLPSGSREHLVDEVLALPEVERADHLSATVPRGDSESLRRLQERCQEVATHAAGASVLVDGKPPRPQLD